MKTRYGFLLTMGGLALFLGACTLGLPSPPLPPCEAADLVAPVWVSPATDAFIDDLRPTFTWDYPDDCDPESFWIGVAPSYLPYYDYAIEDETGSPARSWTPSEDLLPGTEYKWAVLAKVGGTDGPSSGPSRFWTGPVCDSASLVAPSLRNPADGDTVDNAFPPLSWEYPDDTCTPETYNVELTTDPGFGGGSLVADFDSPATSVIPASALFDCTYYYWRVTAENSDGSGPASEVRSFYTDFSGTCGPRVIPMCAAPDLVAPWPGYPSDYSIITELEPTFIWEYPEACFPSNYKVEVTTFGGYGFGTTIVGATSGPDLTWDITEPLLPATDYEWHVAAMAGSDVGPYSRSNRFWTGPICETASLITPILVQPANGSTVTDPYPPLDWEYPDLCVPEDYDVDLSTDPAFTGPSLVGDCNCPADEVIPGPDPLLDCTEYFWRVRASNHDGDGAYTDTWSFFTDFEGACTAPMAKAGAPQNTNCRYGPGTAYEVKGFLMAGERANIVGINAERTWYVIENPDKEGTCWVSAALVGVTGPLDNVQVVIPPPLPTPTPTPTPEPPEEPPPIQACMHQGPNDNQPSCVSPCPENANPGTACTP